MEVCAGSPSMDWLWAVSCGSESYYLLQEMQQIQGVRFAGEVATTPLLRAVQDADFDRFERGLDEPRCARSWHEVT